MHDSLEEAIETFKRIPNRYLVVPALALIVMSVLGMFFSGSSTWFFLALPGGSEAVSAEYVSLDDGPNGVNVTLKREVPDNLELLAKNTNGEAKNLTTKGETVVVPADDGDTILIIAKRGEKTRTILAHPYDAPEKNVPDYGAGDVLWGVGYIAEAGNTSPVATGDRVIGGVGISIRSYNAATGREDWSWKPDKGTSGSPEIHEGSVFVATDTQNASIYALELQSGDVRWEYPTESGFKDASPEYGSGAVYATSKNGVTYAIDAESGELLWKTEDTSASAVSTSPTTTPEYVLTAIEDEAIAYSHDGEPLWKTTVDGELTGKITTQNDIAYYHTKNELIALDTATGDKLWTHDSASNYTTPTVTNQVGYVRAGTEVLALDTEDGDEKWQHRIQDGKNRDSAAGVTFSESVVYVPTSEGIKAVNATTGAKIWAANPGPVLSTPTVWNGTLYAVSTASAGETMLALNTSHSNESSGSLCGGLTGNAEC